jgi:hypothetical protein
MIKNAQNKDMANVETKTDKSEYFFSGGTTHKAKTILASSLREAEEIYENTKELINN